MEMQLQCTRETDTDSSSAASAAVGHFGADFDLKDRPPLTGVPVGGKTCKTQCAMK